MKWTTGLSRNPQTNQAFREAVDKLEVDTTEQVDVLIVFFSSHHGDNVETLSRAMLDEFGDAVCIGCSAGGVVAEGTEAEEEVSLSLVAGELPGVEVAPLRFEPDVHDRADFEWSDHPRLGEHDSPHLLIFSDVETFDAEQMLSGLDRQFPASQKFGALVGGTGTADAMLLEGQIYRDGAIGIAFSGNLQVDTFVAQACRPIGEPLIVTSHTKNVIHRFDKGNPMEVFRQTVRELDPEDQELAQHSMMVGLGLDHKSGEYGQGDFLIRNLMGFNPKSGDMAVAAAIEDLDVVQFHLMDPATSTREFERLLDDFQQDRESQSQTRGALLFSCVERGQQLYGHANHESELLKDKLGELPVGGCFCDGEIGRVGQRTFLHGYASAVTFFRSPSD